MDATAREEEFLSAEFVRRMAAGRNVITKTIPFTNDDVPRYLANLREFERLSREVVINVG